MNNNSPKFNPLTLFGFGGGLVIMVGGLVTGNTALTALGLLGGGSMGATGIVLQNKSQEQTTTPLAPLSQATISAPPPSPPVSMQPDPIATDKVKAPTATPQPAVVSKENEAGEFFDYFLPPTDDKAEIINRLNIFFSKQDLMAQFWDSSDIFEETVTVTLPDGKKRLVADVVTEYKGRPKPPLFFDSNYRIRFVNKPGNIAADFTSPLILMVEGILLKLPNKEEFQYFDWEGFQDIYMVLDGDTPVMDFHFYPDESSPDGAHLCMDIVTNQENHITRDATSLFCYLLARRFWEIELNSPKESFDMGGKIVTAVRFDENTFTTIDKQEIEKLIVSILADDSLNEEAFEELMSQIEIKASPFAFELKTVAYLENDQPIYLDMMTYFSEDKQTRINAMKSMHTLTKMSPLPEDEKIALFIDSSDEFTKSAFVLVPESGISSVANIIANYTQNKYAPFYYDSHFKIFLKEESNNIRIFNSFVIMTLESLIINDNGNINIFSWLEFDKPEMTQENGREIIIFKAQDGSYLGLTNLIEEADIEECKIKIYFVYFTLIKLWKLFENCKEFHYDITAVSDRINPWYKENLSEYLINLDNFVIDSMLLNDSFFSSDCESIEYVPFPFSSATSAPNNLDELIKTLELNAQKQDGQYILIISTEDYVDQDGDQEIIMVISQDVNAEVITINCPRLYTVPAHQQELFAQAAMAVQFRTKFLRYELDESDGEVRGSIELPYSDDRPVTPQQLMRAIRGIVGLIDQYDNFLRSVVNDNEINYNYIFTD
ncbi:hypothetical protein [Synechocystis sp. PCC 6714]|uniref:hypothetical protein n=1 Tax=Synechocystis sp. (strain PCC 6714) TaxID=1147 RepID=UPI0003F9A0FB|nr:hypothetical protein [Synechocystis sp. PCC 6714]AIE76156.1 hypothetical protein D082_41100 [Synechocystis sp. PCC 6714]